MRSLGAKNHHGKSKTNRMSRVILPEGWTSTTKTRTGGVTAGYVEKHYISPSGKRFRSFAAMNRHLENQGRPVAQRWRREDGNTCRNLATRVFSGNDQFAQTPDEIKAWVGAQLGGDFLDVCPANPAFDGLAVPWQQNNYCNPPYKNIAPWLKKAFEEHGNGRSTMLLLPSRTSPMWFHDYVMRAHRVWFVPQGVKFVGYTMRTPFGMMLVHVNGRRPLPRHGPAVGSVDFHRKEARFDANGRKK